MKKNNNGKKISISPSSNIKSKNYLSPNKSTTGGPGFINKAFKKNIPNNKPVINYNTPSKKTSEHIAQDSLYTDSHDIDLIIKARHSDPFSILGLHLVDEPQKKLSKKTIHIKQKWIVRIFNPYAKSISINIINSNRKSYTKSKIKANKIHSDGFFEAILDDVSSKPNYEISTIDFSGNKKIIKDSYNFGLYLGEKDIYHFAEGTHQLYDKFGAQFTNFQEVRGVAFTVWAPNAKRVSVVGDFNRWDGRVNPMRLRIEIGVWELFLPDINPGAHYKFEILDKNDNIVLKTDPLSFYAQCGHENASIIWDRQRYVWGDDSWIESRTNRDPYKSPISIYEVNLGSWRRIPEENNRRLTYRELASDLISYVKDLGFTHIELMPIMEHPYDGSWGYQVTGYFAPTSRFGDPDDFKFFIDQCHRNGIGVILDWVPGHFPKDEHGLANFDGTSLYEHEDSRLGTHQDWGTLIFNYGRNEVKNFLIANALYWLDEFHIDGLRVDAVASMLYLDYSRNEGEWLPNKHGGRENLEAINFIKSLNEICYMRFPGILMTAEESTAWDGVSRPIEHDGLGFGFKWNMGWMNDFLNYFEKDPVHRKYHHSEATFSMIYSYDENFILVLSHDEVVHGKRSLLSKMPGDEWQKFANLRLLYSWMYAHPGKKLLFMGCEFAPWEEWNHNQSLDWHLLEHDSHLGIKNLISDLNKIYREEPSLHQSDHNSSGFSWIRVDDSDNSIFAFVRKTLWNQLDENDENDIYVIVNATPIVRHNYWLNVSNSGFYKEIFNSDSSLYFGSNVCNNDDIKAYPQDDYSSFSSYGISISLPPLSTIYIQKK